MSNKRITVTIFLKNKKKPVCEIEFDNDKVITDFLLDLNSKLEYVKLGNIVFNKNDFDYAFIE